MKGQKTMKKLTKLISLLLAVNLIFQLQTIEVKAMHKSPANYKECYICGLKTANSEKERQDTWKAAEKIVAKAPKTPHEAVKYFHDYLCENVKHDPTIKSGDFYERAMLNTSTYALTKGKATRTGYHDAFHMLCHIAGIECYNISGDITVNGKENAGLDWNVVKLEDGQWYEVDCYLDDAWGTAYNKIDYRYFLKTRKQMSKDHKFRNSYDGEGYLYNITAKGTKYAYDETKGFYNLNNTDSDNTDTQTTIKKGTTFTKKNITYKVLSKNTVEVSNIANTATSITIPETVTYKKTKFKVTSIGKNAGQKSNALKKITISKNVKTISKNAFNSCSSAKTIIIKNASSIKTINANAFKNINKKAVIKIYAKNKKQYKALVKKIKKVTNRKDITYKYYMLK